MFIIKLLCIFTKLVRIIIFRFYTEYSTAPLINMSQIQEIKHHDSFFAFLDLSWYDNVNTGQSTGCFIITYMGRIIDHSSNMPDPVALSMAEAEYNEGYVAFKVASHLRMLLIALKGINELQMPPTMIYFYSKRAFAMENSYTRTQSIEMLPLCQEQNCSTLLYHGRLVQNKNYDIRDWYKDTSWSAT